MKCSVTQLAYSSSNSLQKVQAYVYRPEKIQPKAILQIAHGMCEYFLRYDHFAQFLTSYGYIVCGNDHIGHGNSIQQSNELGYFAPNNGHRYLVEDTHCLTLIMKREMPELPYFLLGHSMGSFVVRAYLDGYSEDLDGAILSGTNGGNPLLDVGIGMAAFLRRTHGEHHRSGFLRKLASLSNGKYEKTYDPEFDWISSDHEVVKSYIADPKCNFVFTAAAYQDLFQLLKNINSAQWGKKIRKDLPLYLFAGTHDPVGDFGKGVKKVTERLSALGIRDLSLKLYENGRHEMLNEVNRQEVYADILAWLESHM